MEYLLQYLLDMTACWVVFLLIYVLFLQRETFFEYNRKYLLSTLLIGLVLPLFRLLPDILKYAAADDASYFVYVAQGVDISAGLREGTSIWTSVAPVLMTIYMLGVAFFSVLFVKNIYKIKQLQLGATIEDYPSYSLVKTQKEHLPFSFFNKVYISNITILNDDIEQIMKHELAHVTGRHSIDIMLIELLKIIMWCHPLLYLYKSALRQSHEFVADQSVCQEFKRGDYGRMLIQHSFSGLQMSLANHFFNAHLKKRITMMYQNPSNKKAGLKYLLALPVVALFFMAFMIAAPEKNEMNNIPELGYSVMDTLPVVQYDTIVEFDPVTMEEKLTIVKSTNDLNKIGDLSSQLGRIDTMVNFDPVTYEETIKIVEVVEVDGKLVKKQRTLPVTADMKLPPPPPNPPTAVAAPPSPPKSSSVPLPPSSPPAPPTNSVPSAPPAPPTPVYEGEGQSDPVFKIVEQMPSFPGCADLAKEEVNDCSDKKLVEYIYKNLKYPEEARAEKTEGMVVLQFIVERDGSISNIKKVRDIGAGCGDEAVRVIKAMNNLPQKWTPGKQRGRPVRVFYTLPVKYKLEATSKSKKNGPGPNMPAQDEEVFKVVEQMPRFPGCAELPKEEGKECSNKNLVEYLYKNIKYPENARAEKVEGTVVLQFIVEKDGGLSNVKILRDIGAGCADEAVRVIQSMNNMPEKWTPGKQRGKAVRVMYVMPVKYKLESNDNVDKAIKYSNKTPKNGPGPNMPSDGHTQNDKVDIQAMYPACQGETDIEKKKDCSQQALLTKVYTSIKYPEEARNNKVEGMVVVVFTVNADGTIQDISLKKDIGSGCGVEALRTMKKIVGESGNWIPAMKDGKAVKSLYHMPIKYKLAS